MSMTVRSIRRVPKPTPEALAKATAWQAPTGATRDSGTRLAWGINWIVATNADMSTVRLRIDEGGRVERWLPVCATWLRVIREDFRPLVSEPLTSERDAVALLDRLQRIEEARR